MGCAVSVNLPVFFRMKRYILNPKTSRNIDTGVLRNSINNDILY